MQSSGATCKTYFCPRISRDFTSSECRLAGAFSIASGGTTFARIAECGQAATQWLHWVQSSSFQMGISSAILRFSQRVVPIGQVPSGGSAETGRASPSPASIAAVTVFTKSGAASETTGGRLALCGFTGCNGTSSTDSRASARACQLRSTRSWPLLL
ncbi:Uncharacterised protein [Shigella sonnei]|nr:Uncharacterised protein [Shigella sonnei]CSG20347.1 Uncharacterised protein [Shigella sonnei]CSQ47844.1 Uncharacterised protein [Shigella sonnei]